MGFNIFEKVGDVSFGDSNGNDKTMDLHPEGIYYLQLKGAELRTYKSGNLCCECEFEVLSKDGVKPDPTLQVGIQQDAEHVIHDETRALNHRPQRAGGLRPIEVRGQRLLLLLRLLHNVFDHIHRSAHQLVGLFGLRGDDREVDLLLDAIHRALVDKGPGGPIAA